MQVCKIYIFMLAFFFNVGVKDSDKRILHVLRHKIHLKRITSHFTGDFLVGMFCDVNIFQLVNFFLACI